MIVASNNPETIVLHAGPRSDVGTGALAVPIVQTTSYDNQALSAATTRWMSKVA